MADIHKRQFKSGRVIWQLTHGTGKNRIRCKAGDSKHEAEATLRRFQQQLAIQGAPPDRADLNAILDAYEVYLGAHKAPATQRRYMRVLATFFGCFMAEKHPSIRTALEVKPHHLEQFKLLRLDGQIRESADRTLRDQAKAQELRAELGQNPVSGSPSENAKYGALGGKALQRNVTRRTINYEVRVLGTFFRWCVKRNYCFIDPTSNVEALRSRQSRLPKYMTREELERFFGECSPWEKRVFSILLLSGMRKGELIHLHWKDVRLELGLIFIRMQQDEAGTEVWAPKVEERIIPISPALEEVLRQHRRAEESTQWVVANRNGNQEGHLLEKLKRVCRKAGIRREVANVHALRHSFGSHLRMAGVPLESISELLGHRDLSSTRIYAKADMTHLREAADRVGDLVSRENVTQRPICENGSRKGLETKGLQAGNSNWLGRRDSNPDSAVQSRMSYH